PIRCAASDILRLLACQPGPLPPAPAVTSAAIATQATSTAAAPVVQSRRPIAPGVVRSAASAAVAPSRIGAITQKAEPVKFCTAATKAAGRGSGIADWIGIRMLFEPTLVAAKYPPAAPSSGT